MRVGHARAASRASALLRRRAFSTAAEPQMAQDKFSIVGSSREGRAIYLDSQATTPLDPRVLDAMMPYMTQLYGNPHSRTHAYGWEAADVVEDGRAKVAALIGADPKEIIFTSGATESNNMAIKGVAHFYKPKKNHVITTVTEHKCVLDSCRSISREGCEVPPTPTPNP